MRPRRARCPASRPRHIPFLYVRMIKTVAASGRTFIESAYFFTVVNSSDNGWSQMTGPLQETAGISAMLAHSFERIFCWDGFGRRFRSFLRVADENRNGILSCIRAEAIINYL